MPKFKNWSKTGDGEWEFDEPVIIRGNRTKPVVHVYQWGSGDDRAYFAELYLGETVNLEELSETIDHNGEVSHYAQPEDAIKDAKENARKFMKQTNTPDEIRDAVDAPAIRKDWSPGRWRFVETDEDYVLFEDPDDWDNNVVIEKQEDDTWNIVGTNASGNEVTVQRGLNSFDKAMDMVYDYMEDN